MARVGTSLPGIARGRWYAVPALLLATGCNLLTSAGARDRKDERIDRPTIAKGPAAPSPPSKRSFRVPPYVFLSDFEIDSGNPLFAELGTLRDQVEKELRLPPATAPVNVYLFETRDRYEAYMNERYPGLPARRAFFIAQPRGLGEDLIVCTWWGPRIRFDLRHELTHALLHGVLREVPLWLDEGLAEFFELPLDRDGVNAEYVKDLRRSLATGHRPNLARLEGLQKVQDMNPAEYREAWAWVHLMLRGGKPEAKQALLVYLQGLRNNRQPGPLRAELAKVWSDPEAELRQHLGRLATQEVRARATPD